MRSIIHSAIDRARTVLLVLALVFIAGAYSYISIPKEAEPDIPIPVIYISVTLDGISPEDAVNLLVKPLEQELRSIDGLDEMEATAYEGGANVVLHFEAGFDNDEALDEVREKVDTAKAELPDDADEPRVKEINISLFPILTVILSGEMPERTMQQIAEDLQDEIEAIPGVLEAPIKGIREEQLLIEIDRAKLEGYGITAVQINNVISGNNLLVAAGSLELEKGRYAVKVPGLFKTAEDLLNLPIVAKGDQTIRVRDVGEVKLNFKDTVTISRVNGKSAVTLEISKRIGENVIETVDAVKQKIQQSKPFWPQGMEISYTGDKSTQIRNMLNDLQNNVAMSVILVMVVVLAAMGLRPAILVAIAIPGSFLMAITVLFSADFTTNIVVLFSLILAVGMLVDGAIVVTELADKRLQQGEGKKQAFKYASKQMAWPIIASTATTLAAFFPLLFWPGIMGEFMKFLPLTLIFTLTASLLMALIFLPAIGANFPGLKPSEVKENNVWGERYARLLKLAIKKPVKTLLISCASFIVVMISYGWLGSGVEFFPNIEPERANISIHTKGDLSISEKDTIMRDVQTRLGQLKGVDTTYISTLGTGSNSRSGPSDKIGNIFLEFAEWDDRKPLRVDQVLEDVNTKLSEIKGIRVEAKGEKEGPGDGKPIKIAITATTFEQLVPYVQRVRTSLENINGVINIDDDLPDQGIEWAMQVDRASAARAGTNLAEVGGMLRMATTGAIIGKYRPEDSNDEIDIVARFKSEDRNLDSMLNLHVPTENGSVPMQHFVKRVPQQKVSVINRLDQSMSAYVEADVSRGVLADDVIKQLMNSFSDDLQNLPLGVSIKAKGENEDQAEAQAFLGKAFVVAIFIMAIILVTQFNSFYQAFIILFAVIMSTAGVLLGHIITGKPFGIVMSGLGVIALAGIVVNNNIVLIDTFNNLVKQMHWRDALVETGRQRLRPVMLTAITTVVGLIPMATKVNVDLINRAVSYNAPSSQWWDQLASAIIFGLTFATVLTLVVTPSMIAIGRLLHERFSTEH